MKLIDQWWIRNHAGQFRAKFFSNNGISLGSDFGGVESEGYSRNQGLEVTSITWADVGPCGFFPCFDSHDPFAWPYLLASLAASTSIMGRD